MRQLTAEERARKRAMSDAREEKEEKPPPRPYEYCCIIYEYIRYR